MYEGGVPLKLTAPDPAADQATLLRQRVAFVADTTAALQRVSDPRLWRDKTLRIEFVGQPGMDWGGLTTAFLQVMADCLFDPEAPDALFAAVGADADVGGPILDGTSEHGHQPPPVAGRRRLLPDSKLATVSEAFTGRLRLIGQLIGYMLWTGEVANLPLLPSVYAYLVGQRPPYWRELMLDDPADYKSTVQILEMPADQLEFCGFVFAYEDPADPAQELELCPGGADIELTAANRREWAQLRAEMAMHGRCARGLAEIASGFHDVVGELRDFGPFRELTEQPAELQLLLCGTATIDVADLQRQTCYKNCRMQTKECKWFFETLASWDRGEPGWAATAEDLADQQPGKQLVCKMVHYATGCPRSPPGGFQNMRNKANKAQPFTIKMVGDADWKDSLPRAHTCFNRIDFGEYSSKAHLAKLLWKALLHGMNFMDA